MRTYGLTLLQCSGDLQPPVPRSNYHFAHVVEDPDNAPLLIHCGSANRVGAMWALYRALKGIPEEIALEEARTIGLQSDSEAEIRTWLAVWTPTK